MSAEQWIFRYGGSFTVFTSSVLSFSGNQGRQRYIDNYAGGSFNITIKNNNNEAANFVRGTNVQILFSDGTTVFIEGKVIGITYDDHPGNVGMSTATISCQDAMTQAGKFNLQAFTGYTTNWTTLQAQQTNYSISGLSTPEVVAVGVGLSLANQVNTYNGTILDRLNLLNNTERGQLVVYANLIKFLSRAEALAVNTVSFHRTTSSSTSIAYTDIRRINSFDTFMNQVSITFKNPTGVVFGPFFANNTTSQSAYGVSGYSLETADISSLVSLGLASWLTYVQGDPALLRFEIDFDDAVASNTAILSFLKNATVDVDRNTSVTWRLPGAGSDTTTSIVFEGFSFTGTPSQTSYTGYFTPLSVYQYFILDSSTQGILDTSRLSWGYY